MVDTIKRAFTISNTADGLRWWIGPLEADLRAYCWSKGLSIEVFKSGWLFQHLAFSIKGVATTSDTYGYVDDLEQIYARYAA